MITNKHENTPTEDLYEMWKQNHMTLPPQDINIIIGQLVSRLRKYEAKDGKEVDSGCNKAQGCIEGNSRCQKGRKDSCC